MRNIKPYEKYKPSGVDWLGEIPEHWESVKLGIFFEERREKVSDTDFLPLSVTKNGIVPQLENAAKTMHGDNRKKVCKGDFVINSRSDRKGSSGLAYQDGSVSVINIVLKPREIEPKFSEYLLKSYQFKEEYYRYGRGIVEDLWTTRYSEMKNMGLPKPTFDEQKKIAIFLDYKISKIDRFIHKKKQLIKLLNEQKATIINQSVTKGINKNGKMKPSGIDWLRDIPEHWEIKKLKYSVSLNKHTSFDFEDSISNKIALEYIESQTGRLINYSESAFDGIGTIFKKGDVLFGKLRPYLAKVISVDFEGSCVNEILVLTPNLELWDSDYLKYKMLAFEFIQIVNNSTYGSKMPRASWNFIGNIKLSCPPKSEQIKIVEFIEKETENINLTISTIEKEIALVQEYRTTLIAETVTGKIDVRDYEIPMFEEAEEVIEEVEAEEILEEIEESEE